MYRFGAKPFLLVSFYLADFLFQLPPLSSGGMLLLYIADFSQINKIYILI